MQTLAKVSDASKREEMKKRNIMIAPSCQIWGKLRQPSLGSELTISEVGGPQTTFWGGCSVIWAAPKCGSNKLCRSRMTPIAFIIDTLNSCRAVHEGRCIVVIIKLQVVGAIQCPGVTQHSKPTEKSVYQKPRLWRAFATLPWL